MAQTLNVELECPECEAVLTREDSNCPKCRIEIDWSLDDESNKEDVNEMLEDILSKSRSKGAKEAESKEPEAGPDEGPHGLADEDPEEAGAQPEVDEGGPVEEASDDAKSPGGRGTSEPGSGEELADEGQEGDESDEEVERGDELDILEEEESEEETISDEIDDMVAPTPKTRRLYAKTFSTLGIITVALAFLSLVGLLILLNWDTWIKGDANGSIGDTQMTAIYATVIITILLFTVSAGDAYRSRNVARG